LKEYYYRCNRKQFARGTARYLQLFCSRAWSKMTEVRLEQGDKEADELEANIRFLETILDECKQLAW